MDDQGLEMQTVFKITVLSQGHQKQLEHGIYHSSTQEAEA